MFFNIDLVIAPVPAPSSKIVKLKRMGAMPHNGYRPFNIKLIHKNFKDIKKNQLNLNLENYINLFSNNEN